MKQLQKDLQSAAKALNALAKKIDAISKKLGGVKKTAPAKPSPAKATQKKTAVKTVKKSAPKKPVVATGSDRVLKIVSGSQKGVSTAALIGKTGFNAKRVQNTVFRLRKLGKIKSLKKGVYVKA